MSDTSLTRPSPSPGGEAAPPDETDDARERGVLRVADRVVEKVARAAVLSVPGVAPDAATTGTVGRALGRAYPHVSCSRSGDRARVQLEIALVWPAPAERVAREVCEAVTERLEFLAGVRVDEVRATVARIVDPSDVLEATGTTKERRVQ